MKSMSKAQLADAAGVSMKTLLGVRPRDKVLPPVAVRYVAEQYGIDL